MTETTGKHITSTVNSMQSQTSSSVHSMASIRPGAFRNACGMFGTGVTVITTRSDGVDYGMTANAFMSISLAPPLIAVSVANTTNMLVRIRQSGRFAVSILEESCEALALHFAGRPDGSVAEPFFDFDDLPGVKDACTVLAAEVEQEVAAGDHVIFVGRVSHIHVDPEKAPLMFHKGRFGKLLSHES
ncbi:flavin reductase family protein [Bradyrhizobium sp. Tv2a-2]|uniref:flavin reductase family protein n=1 Tax=Bradyrhizobium sp. Tv2a-2 TaxID=113395 RepID=UPI001FD9F0CE|nr:flavin reductase family protein [Bradyrhizobium sp. Tv2a-2]